MRAVSDLPTSIFDSLPLCRELEPAKLQYAPEIKTFVGNKCG